MKYESADEYFREVVIMLDRQPGDYHIGAAERTIIATCWKNNRPVSSAVAYIMKGCNNS